MLLLSLFSSLLVFVSFPPYSLERLAELHGGSSHLLAKLHNLLDRPSDFMFGKYRIVLHSCVPVELLSFLDLTLSPLQCHVLPSYAGSYNQEIHEMTEAQAFGMGQYGHNNQPVD
jgi:hypothetical protein